ncbi:hypothetical protein SHKM778_09310 [Streptomyces sp. KM77-8]|uniref:Uncharacterized protein n=1 Tax=Streptomyces haneummycinicus TaxID=3074435 RepID=A0AAT9HAX7_9ACTN
MAIASFAANRAASEATPRRSPLGNSNSLSRNSRCANAGVRSNDAANLSISATSIPTPMMLMRALYGGGVGVGALGGIAAGRGRVA